jgi:hypothetical protein
MEHSIFIIGSGCAPLPNEHWLILNTMFMSTYIKKFHEISIRDVAVVGGKNASLGEMTTTLAQAGIKVPQGFATTSDAFWFFMISISSGAASNN